LAGRRVSPVEVLYATFPSFLFINATYGGWLLEPLLEVSESPRWTFDYAPMDLGMNLCTSYHVYDPCFLGTSYPNATGNFSPHDEGVERK
jgi:hypothetical protein